MDDIKMAVNEKPLSAVVDEVNQQLKRTTRRLKWVAFGCMALITLAPFAGAWLANSGH